MSDPRSSSPPRNLEPQQDVERFRDAVMRGDAEDARRLLALPHVSDVVNEPLFAFGQRAIHAAAKDRAMIDVLVSAGADLNLVSDWANGPYRALDHASDETARYLIARGAHLTPNAAARLGWLDELRNMVDGDPTLVHARGGDGQQPLHEARTPAVADFLLDRGAEIDARCVDHQATPAQYALVDRPDVCRRLLARGATPDIFMAAALGDVSLAMRLVDSDPACIEARINEPGYAPVPPSHIYCWSLGFGLTPHDVAVRFEGRELQDFLASRSSPALRLMNAIAAGDAGRAHGLLASQPDSIASLSPREHGHLALAIFHERFDAAALMLDLGFDPAAPGMDGGTALHAACWVGNVRMVERLLAHGGVPIDARDPTHGSTPLGWAAFGSVHRRAGGADYPAVAERLVAAGADVAAPGNRAGLTVLAMAQGNAPMQAALRRLGAT